MKRTDVCDELRDLIDEAIDALKKMPEVADQLEETRALSVQVRDMLAILKEWHDTTIPTLRPRIKPRFNDWLAAPRPSKPIIFTAPEDTTDTSP